jgi:hypothetical protein
MGQDHKPPELRAVDESEPWERLLGQQVTDHEKRILELEGRLAGRVSWPQAIVLLGVFALLALICWLGADLILHFAGPS